MRPKQTYLIVFAMAMLPGYIAGQAIVEHAVISGATATAAGAVKKAASSISGALKKLDSTLDTPNAAPPDKMPSAVPVKPAKTFEDPAGIKTGMSQAELLNRFGDPAMRISGEGGEQTLFYSQKDGHLTRVRVSGDRVAAVVE